MPGNPDLPFEHPELEDAAKTWNGAWWEIGGGGTAWDSMAYDPELDLLYVGTGNGSPWNRELRSPGGGDNLYLSSILAIEPDSGRLKWHYQTTPRDNWDYHGDTAHYSGGPGTGGSRAQGIDAGAEERLFLRP